jgi:tripartite ATP-independent transporter DctM subunit
MLGHIPGGLAHTTVGSCAVFGAISGSTSATVASIGGAIFPKLIKAGYRDTFCYGLIVNASNLAALIPPSILMILYGVNVKASIGELFISGIGPGILVSVMFMIYCYFWAKKNKVPLEKKANFKERLRAVADAKWALGLPVIILGGTFGGVFSPSETAAVSVLYSLVVEIYIYRSLKWNEIPRIAIETGALTAVVFILLGASQFFSWVLTFSQIPQRFLQYLVANPYMNKWTFLILVNVCFFIACMIIDGAPAMLIMNPILYPVAIKYGIDPIHLGIIITMQTTIGAGTPPFGVNIFAACAVFKDTYLRVISEVWVFIAILIVAAVIVSVFPQTALFLRDLLYAK